MISEVNVAVPAAPGVEAGMVVLGEVDQPHRRLRIVIAQPEARAIQGAWTGAIPARPSTWDLFVSAVALLEGRIDRVVITAVQEERHFFANLELEREGERRTLSCRPSDAVAVALRAYGAEIYAAREVVDAVGLAEDGTRYGPYVKPEESAGTPPAGPPPEPASVTFEEGPAEAGIAAAEEPDTHPEAPTRGVGRTRSGRLPRKALPRKAGPRDGGSPARKTASPAKRADAPLRKRTPPAR